MSNPLQELVDDLEKNLRHFILEHGEKIRFNQTQYSMEPLIGKEGNEIGYKIFISISGFGEQYIEVGINPPEFNIKGKILKNCPEGYPFEIINQFVTGVMNKWLESEGDLSPIPTIESVVNAVAESHSA